MPKLLKAVLVTGSVLLAGATIMQCGLILLADRIGFDFDLDYVADDF